MQPHKGERGMVDLGYGKNGGRYIAASILIQEFEIRKSDRESRMKSDQTAELAGN